LYLLRGSKNRADDHHLDLIKEHSHLVC
jgi:hypothetical protein